MADFTSQHQNAPDPGRNWWEGLRPPVRQVVNSVRTYGTILLAPDTSWWKRARYGALGAAVLGAICTFFLVVYTAVLIPFTPSLSSLRAARVENPSIVLSADGQEIVRYNRLNRKWVDLEEISPVVVDALLATEDHRFYKHGGIDVYRLFGAIWSTVLGDPEGGSTITMQLARNLYPEEIGNTISVHRKLKEMITAVKLEYVFDKDDILEMYLNTVPFLYNTHGIEMAAQTYFATPAAELDTLEAATLIGMLKGTTYYNPVRNPERAQYRRNIVLGQMARYGELAPERAAALQQEPVELNFEPQSVLKSRAPHFTAHVRDMLQSWADANGYDLFTDGLVIHTTLDLRLQEMAQKAVSRQLDALQRVADVEWGRGPLRLVSTQANAYEAAHGNVEPFSYFWEQNPGLLREAVRESERYRSGVSGGASEEEMLDQLMEDEAFLDSLKAKHTRLEGGFVAMDPRTGHVKAWVGSRNFYEDQFDHVAAAARQPGSTFKPFVYGAALEAGISPYDLFVDQEVAIPSGDGGVWRPTNMGGSTGEVLTVREGLAKSVNTITAQLMWRLGPDKVAEYAKRMGIRKSKLEEVPSLALGTSDVTLLEMVSAYTTIANQGVYRAPVLVTRIEDKAGNVLATFAPEAPETAMERDAALTLLDMMRGVINEGTGVGLRYRFGIDADVAGKTGTTQNNADGWFILMHPELVGGSWVGFNDRRVAFRSNYWGQGAHNALFVVGDFYREAFQSGALNAGTRFPEPPALNRRNERGGFLNRLESWFERQFGKRNNDDSRRIEGEREFELRPPPKVESDQDKERAKELTRQERRRAKIAEERARKLREREEKRARREWKRRQEAERVGW